jgi:hypothetical protein
MPVDDLDDWDTEDDTVPCPYCREPIPEDTPRCPYCENYISEEDEAAPSTPKPWWLILGVLACLFAVYLWIVRW